MPNEAAGRAPVQEPDYSAVAAGFTDQEFERRTHGHLERTVHQIAWELEYSGFLAEIADLAPCEKRRRFDVRMRSITELVRCDVLHIP